MWDLITDKTLIKNVGNFFNQHTFLEGNVNVIDVLKEFVSTMEKQGITVTETMFEQLIETFKLSELNQ